MQPDLPTPTDVSRRLKLKNVTIGEARERTIQLLTDHWLQSLLKLAQTLKAQGFSDEETLALCETMKPMFEKNLTEALLQFDQDADTFIEQCSASEKTDG
jgi:hypothetical protein